jgi:cytochrome c oxidase subunit III
MMAVANTFEDKDHKQKVMKPLLWVGMISIVMLFAGLTSAMIVRKSDGVWLQFYIPTMFWVSTVVILLSSATLFMALQSAKKARFGAVKAFLGITLLLGLVFTWSQVQAWAQLTDGQVYFTGSQSNASGSFLYILTLVHLLHLLGGLVALSVVFFKSFKNAYEPKNLLGLQVCSIYWHFLDAIWLYLFLFLSYIV